MAQAIPSLASFVHKKVFFCYWTKTIDLVLPLGATWEKPSPPLLWQPHPRLRTIAMCPAILPSSGKQLIMAPTLPWRSMRGLFQRNRRFNEMLLNILYHKYEFWEEIPIFSFHLSTPKQIETWDVIMITLGDKVFEQLVYGSWSFIVQFWMMQLILKYH